MIFKSSAKVTKNNGSVTHKEDLIVTTTRHNIVIKRVWKEFFMHVRMENMDDANNVKVEMHEDEDAADAVIQSHENQFHVPTAIQVIAENKRDEMINNSCLKHYVQQKWKNWGVNLLQRKLYWTALSFCIFMGFIISRSAYMLAAKGTNAESTSRNIALAFYIALLILEIRNMWIELCLYRVYSCSQSKYYSKMHGTARAYTFVTVLFQLTIIAGAIATAFGSNLAENICFAASSFLCTCSLLWCCLGDESIGKLIMSIIEIISCDLYSFSVVYTLTISGFTAAFYLLSPQISLINSSNAYEYDSQPVLLYIQRYCEMLFNGFTPGSLGYASYVAPNIQWYAELLCFLFLFCTPILMLNLLIAIMNDRYSEVQKSVSTRWLLEMCNIMARFEMELIAMNDVHHMKSSPFLSRIENLVDEFKLFTITVGQDVFNKYIEIETINNNWNNQSSESNNGNEKDEDEVQNMHDEAVLPTSKVNKIKSRIRELKKLLDELQESI